MYEMIVVLVELCPVLQVKGGFVVQTLRILGYNHHMKGRTTSTIATRIPDTLYLRVQKKAQAKGLTPSQWLKRLVE